jgi:hypothetical protein
MITSIIFSKDRPLQLDLALKSVRKNFFAQNNISVLYKETTGYADSYKTLQNEYPDVVFHKQGHSIFQDINLLISESEDGYVVFFTDDNIFYRKISFTFDDMTLLFNENISCLSLRMGVNATQREINGVTGGDAIPEEVFAVVESTEIGHQFIAWNRTTVSPGGYWSYVFSVDGHVFKKETIASICDELLYQSQYCGHKNNPKWQNTPNEFESKLQRFHFEVPAFMAAPKYSCVVNSPNNRVQNSHNNISGSIYPLAPHELNEQFQKGQRLNPDKISFGDIISPHTEIDLLAGLE